MPPFDGPRAMLCVTRYPSKTRTVPSSMPTGIATTTAFLHSESTLTRFESISKTSATRRSCSRAMSYGFSRRCETGASTVTCRSLWTWERPDLLAKRRPEYTRLADSERERAACRRAPRGRHGDDPELVDAASELGPGGAAAGDPELVAAREHVPQAGEEAEPDAPLVPQGDVEPLERLHLVVAGRVGEPAGLEREHGGLLVRRVEGRERERDTAEEVAPRGTEGDRPRHAQRLVADRADEDRALRGCRPDGGARGGHAERDLHRVPAGQAEARGPGREAHRGRALARVLDPDPDREVARREVPHDERLPRFPARAAGAADREARRLDGELGGRGGARVDAAGALRGHWRRGERARRLGEEGPERRGVQRRPRLGEEGRRPGDDGRRRARAVDRAVGGRAGGVRAGLGGGQGDPRRDELRLHPPVEGEPGRGERRHLTSARIRCRADAADRDAGARAAPQPDEDRAGGRFRDVDNRDRRALVEAGRAAREAAVDEDGRGSSARGVRHRC